MFEIQSSPSVKANSDTKWSYRKLPRAVVFEDAYSSSWAFVIKTFLTFSFFLSVNFFLGPKPMQDSWGNGEDMGHWDAEEGDMWNSPTSQESSSSCNSWGNGPKKIPNKVRKTCPDFRS